MLTTFHPLMSSRGRYLAILAMAVLTGLAPRAAQAQRILVASNAVWAYRDDGSDQGTGWRELAFNDAGWLRGPAELGYGDTIPPENRPEATVLSYGFDPLNKPITCYFRHTFNLTNVISLTNLIGRLVRDDGAVVYLNGVEVIRSAMPDGSITFQTRASEPGISGVDEETFYAFNIDGPLLREGLNVIAAEVHQVLPTSSDLSFAFELQAITNAPPPPDANGELVLPGTLATRDAAFGSGTLRAANYRSQQVYGSVHFPEGFAFFITELRFRPDFQFGRAFVATIANIQVNLSTTERSPDALSSVFAANLGADDTVVFSGPLTVSSDFVGPATGPKAFDIVIPLDRPFLYDPGAGNLLLDIRNFSGSTASHLSGDAASGDAASRVGGSVQSSTGGVDTGIDALQIAYVLTNAPPRPPKPTRLLRGPYLQCATTNNIIVCWRTDRATNSLVRFGPNPGALSWQVAGGFKTNNHFVTLTNLAPDTKYFYSIGTGETNFAGGPLFYFITAPARPKPTRIWALGDPGTANQPQGGALYRDPWAVRDAYHRHTGSRETDVWIMLGDNAYISGTDDQYQTNLFETYPEMLRRAALWPAIGNHEVNAFVNGRADAPDYLAMFALPKNGEAGGVPSGVEHYYSFDYGNIHFICLDSEVSANALGSPMIAWLEADLAANTNSWIIAFWHSPPYDKGTHDSDSLGDTGGHLYQMRQNVVPILEDYGVDLILCGHSHAYQRSYLIDGHYGESHTWQPIMAKDSGSGRPEDSGPYLKATAGLAPHEGAVYVVCGSSGWVTPLIANFNHPAHFISLQRLGSMVIDVDGLRLDAKFLRETGAIDDHFTIIKGAAAEPLKFATFHVGGGMVNAQLKTVAGARYRIDKSPALEPPAWTPASGDILATGATTRWSAPAPPGSENCYFRAVRVD